MSRAARALNCPNCGSGFELKGGRKTKTATCSSCGSTLDVSKPPFAVLGQLDQSRHVPLGDIRLGQTATVDGIAYEVIGRIRLGEEGSFWDEWLCLGPRGKTVWLGEDAGRLSVQRVFTPEEAPDFDAITAGPMLNVDGTRYMVDERGGASVMHIEGELTWRAKLGDAVGYVDALRGIERVGIEWTEEEIEFFRVEPVTRKAMWEILGLTDKITAFDAAVTEAAGIRKAAQVLLLVTAVCFGLGVVLGGGLFDSKVVHLKSPIATRGLDTGLILGKAKLGKGFGRYVVEAEVDLPHNVNHYALSLHGADGKTLPVIKFVQDKPARNARIEGQTKFTVPGAEAEYELVLDGQVDAAVTQAAPDGRVTLKITRERARGSTMILVSIVLLLMAMFKFGAAKRAAPTDDVLPLPYDDDDD